VTQLSDRLPGLDKLSGILRRSEGFGLVFVVGPHRGALAGAKAEVTRQAAEFSREVVTLNSAGTGASSVVVEVIDALEPRRRAAQISRLNQSRDALAAHKHVVVVMVLEAELAALAEAAPDLWSVRTTTLQHSLAPAASPPRGVVKLQTDHPVPPSLARLCDRFSLVGLELRDGQGRSLPAASLQRLYQDLRVAGPPLPDDYHRQTSIGPVQSELLRYRMSLLEGSAGSGKSTALKVLARTLAQAGTPVVLQSLGTAPLKSLDLLDPEKGLHALAAACPWTPEPSPSCWVLLDGLDEVSEPSLRALAVAWLDDLSRSGRIKGGVVATRPGAVRDLTQASGDALALGLPFVHVPQIRVLPLQDHQIHGYIDAWIELAVSEDEREHQRRTLRQTVGLDPHSASPRSRRLRELCRRPLFLAAVAALVRRRGAGPDGEYELLEAFVDVLIHRRKEALAGALSADDLRTLAGEVAWVMHKRNVVSISEQQLLQDAQLVDTKGLSSLRHATGLLAEDPSQVTFAHVALQEILVAGEAIARLGWSDIARLQQFVWSDQAGNSLPSRVASLTVERLAAVSGQGLRDFITASLKQTEAGRLDIVKSQATLELMADLWGARPPLVLRAVHRDIREQLWNEVRPPKLEDELRGPLWSLRRYLLIIRCVRAADMLPRLGDERLGRLEWIELDQGWALARWPLSRRDYAAFIEDGGYELRRWWTPRGWSWRRRRARSRTKDSPDRWDTPGFDLPSRPVVGVSLHEAEAFVAWAQVAIDPRICLPPLWLWQRAVQADPYLTPPISQLERFALYDQPTPGPLGASPHRTTPDGVQGLGGFTRCWLAPGLERKEHFAGWAFCDAPRPLRETYVDRTGRGGRRWDHPFGIRLARAPS
jgi:energy-coupling factor transporter ATP-binding protein EcfA2